jgi:hypothetical protein
VARATPGATPWLDGREERPGPIRRRARRSGTSRKPAKRDRPRRTCPRIASMRVIRAGPRSRSAGSGEGMNPAPR